MGRETKVVCLLITFCPSSGSEPGFVWEFPTWGQSRWNQPLELPGALSTPIGAPPAGTTWRGLS